MGEILTDITGNNLFYYHKKSFRLLSGYKNINKFDKYNALSIMHRINILFMVMHAGSGHIGSSFSIIDYLTVFYQSSRKHDLIFSSKGHDSPAFYSIGLSQSKIPFDKFFKFRKINGLPGHPDRSINFFKFNTGSLGMGVSKAKGYLNINKRKKAFVILGDGELQEGQIWESINSKINSNLKIIIDKNNLQSDFITKNTSDIGNIVKKFNSFNLRVKEIDGHNFDEIEKSINEINQYDCLILKTVKGKGVKIFHGNKKIYGKKNYPFHSGAPKYEIYNHAIKELQKNLNKIFLKNKISLSIDLKSFKPQIKDLKIDHKKISMISLYESEIQKAMKNNNNIFCLDADLLVDHGLYNIKKKYPKRLIECGIAEMDMVSQASGLAHSNKLPICHSFSCFLSFRSLEQIYNNCSEKRKIMYTASLVGVVPSGPGHSHQAVKDFSNYATIPNLVVCEPINPSSMGICINNFINSSKESLFLRLNPLPIKNINHKYNANKKNYFPPLILKDWDRMNKNNKKLLIITYGSTLSEKLLEASKKVKKNNIKIISLIYLNRFDYKFFKSEISKADKIIFYDNQISGFTPLSLLVNELNNKINFYFKYQSNSIEGFPICGANDEVLDFYNFSEKKIIQNLNKQ